MESKLSFKSQGGINMKILRELENKISEFIDSESKELVLNSDESILIFSFSEEYEKLINEAPKQGIGNIIANSFGIKDVYLGGALDSKKGKHFMKMYKMLPDKTSIYLSMSRISDVKFDENEILNRIFVDVKNIDICKLGNDQMILKKEEL